MPTTLTNGIQLPDKGSVDWYSSMQSNYNLIDTHLGDTDAHVTAEDKANWDSKQGSLSQTQLDAIAQVATNTNDIATLQSGKANASHTHSSSDITDIGDYATKQYVDNSISGLVDSAPNALDTLNELAAALNDDANFASTVTTALATKANSADLATVATSGSYNDLSNKPTINDSTITIQKNGSTVDTFTTNGSAKTINIPVPTKTSDLTNDSNFVDTSNPAVASGITSAKVTDYDTHIADTDIHVTTADKATWNTVTSKANDSDVVHKSGDETISGNKTFSSNVNVYNSDSNATTPNLYFRSSKIEISSQGNTSGDQNLTYLDKNNTDYANVKGAIQANGSAVKIRAVAKDSSDNSVINELQLLAFTNGNKAIFPSYSNEIDLGLSNYKWKAVYATNYYYGSNNVEFSTKFVTTDTAQTISGAKTFTDNIVAKKIVSNVSQLQINARSSADSVAVIAGANASEGSGIWLYGKDTATGSDCRIQIYNTTKSRYERVDLVGSQFLPNPSGELDCGGTSNKWKSINGINPGALSFPRTGNSANTDYTNVLGNITVIDPNTQQPYTNEQTFVAPATGWLVMWFPYNKVTSCMAWLDDSVRACLSGTFTVGYPGITLPVIAGSTIHLRLNATQISGARLYYCQGNV